MTPNTREQLAEYAHEAWSGWMRYLFSKCIYSKECSVIIPEWAVERWKRQMNTAYRDLPKTEKDSDLAEADTIMGIVYGKLDLATLPISED